MSEERYQQRQQRVKDRVDARVAAAKDERGIIIVFTGNGKGKTTAAFGTATRAVGHGKKVGVVQFIKGTWPNGERNLLEPHGVEFQVMAYDYLPLEEVINALKARPAHQTVIITGRGCHRDILELADTVSELRPVKHAFEAGVKAQAGIDY